MAKSDQYLRALASKRKGYTDLPPGDKKYRTMALVENVYDPDMSAKKRREMKKALREIAYKPSGLKAGGAATHGLGRAFLKGGKV